MNYALHNFVAFSYFIATSILIFLFGIKIHKANFRIGQLSLFMGIISTILPYISMKFINTLAIPETIHIVSLFVWLIILEHDKEVINLIKKVGL